MSLPQAAATADQIDDLHLMMAVAILAGQRGVEAPLMPIFDTWSQHYPQDALAGIGRGLHLIGHGNPEAGYAMIEDAARTATTRAAQARDVLDSLASDFPELAR
ncbi:MULTISPECIES: hypothetical protein [Paracoccus]|uniref:Uncharacterized protein n=1 Tax=Paracoccus sanguinis TaxID=1545044 RepID=A0A1H3AL82_9RHOB|nr:MULTISPECIES: hypothetical protein [Paracoccus]QJD18428.1 hypothetical protein HGN31_15595 [Paracoccus sanguinis]SDX30383.1 hypothetical protein SAMN05444276_104122 [Paracoccus sanguinis]